MDDGTVIPAVTKVPDRFAILVVCTANICRSPLAERLLHAQLSRSTGSAGVQFDVRSAGVRGRVDEPMDPSAAAELQRLGGDSNGFRSRSLTDHDCEVADLILTATREHRTAVLERVPRALRRTFTLTEFAHLVSKLDSTDSVREMVTQAAARRGSATIDEYDVDDPFERGPAKHREVAEAIYAASSAIAASLNCR